MVKKVLILLLFPCVCMGDFWSTNSQEFALTPDVTLNTLSEVRLHEKTSDVFLQYVGVTSPVSETWSTGLWYKYVLLEDNAAESHRGLIDATYKQYGFSNRFRFEYNLTNDHLIYRNKVKLTKAFRLLDREIYPFIADEPFATIRPFNGYKENRFWMGAGLKTKNITFELSRLWRDTKGYDMKAVCLSVKVRF